MSNTNWDWDAPIIITDDDCIRVRFDLQIAELEYALEPTVENANEVKRLQDKQKECAAKRGGFLF